MNPLAGKPVKLKGSKPVLTIMFGNASGGVYRFYLFDTDNKNPKLFGQGLSTDQIPDTFAVPVKQPPQAVHVEFGVHATFNTDTTPVTLVLSDNGVPFWTHTYLVLKNELNKGLVDHFFLTI